MKEELSAEMQRLLHAITGEMARRDIQERLGLKHPEHFHEAYLAPALAAGLIERTAPNKPTSQLQRYRLTEKGRAWLVAREQPGGGVSSRTNDSSIDRRRIRGREIARFDP